MIGRPREYTLTGQVFGRLTVLKEAPLTKGNRNRRWWCLCACGNKLTVRQDALHRGDNLSCGCFAREKHTTHGETVGGQRTPEYRLWQNMISRCHRPSMSAYPWYGGRGIKVCTVWRNSFEQFLADVGRRPSPQHSLDRKDNNKHYCKANVHWALKAEQQQNRRNAIRLTFRGETLFLKAWAEQLQVPYARLYVRYRMHQPIEKILKEFVE